MAKPISPTPILEGEDAIEFLKELERVDRGELTEGEIKIRKMMDSLERVVYF